MSLSEKLEAARVALGKRKERELQAQGLLAPGPANKKAQPGKPTTTSAQGGSGGGNNNDNNLLAGHLAHEFLTRGTLLGRRVEPSRGGPAAPAPAPAPAAEPEPEADAKRRYVEASWLLMTSGAHIPGVVNPTQLARWLHIKE